MCKNFYFDIFISKGKGFVKDESVALKDQTDNSDPKKVQDEKSRTFGIRWALS